jgi:hypothetical protein
MDPSPTTPGRPTASTPASASGEPAFQQERRELHDIGSQASDALASARQKTTDAAGAATQSVKEVATQVKNQATDATQKAVSQLKEHGQRAVSEQKDRTATTLSDVGSALQNAADRLRQDHDDNIASYIDAMAGMSTRAGSYLRDADVSSLVGDLQSVARRNPGLFLGGMFVAGLAVARFAKASRPQTPSRPQGQPRGQAPYQPPTYQPPMPGGQDIQAGGGHRIGAYTTPAVYPVPAAAAPASPGAAKPSSNYSAAGSAGGTEVGNV